MLQPRPGYEIFWGLAVQRLRRPIAETAFLRLRALHNPLMEHRTTIAATCAFLETGRLFA